MKTSDRLFELKAKFHEEVVNALSELYDKILEKLPDLYTLYFDEYVDKGICEWVGTWIMNNDGETGEWAMFTAISKNEATGKLYITASGDYAERYDDAYGYFAEELVYLYDELEKIYESLA